MTLVSAIITRHLLVLCFGRTTSREVSAASVTIWFQGCGEGEHWLACNFHLILMIIAEVTAEYHIDRTSLYAAMNFCLVQMTTIHW